MFSTRFCSAAVRWEPAKRIGGVALGIPVEKEEEAGASGAEVGSSAGKAG